MIYTMNNINEESKIIEGLETYSVSIFGNVKNNKTDRILKQCIDRKGYIYVNLSENNKGKNFRCHRLIAQAYIPNPENKTCVDHINNDRIDNRIENLRWVSVQQNNQNRRITKINKSGYIGVIFEKDRNKWKATIGGKIIGRFTNKEDAIRARLEKSKELFGEFRNQCEIMMNELYELDKELEMIINS